MIRLFLLFTLVPALELFLLLQIGSVLGPLSTFLLILVTGAVGAALARREGFAVLQQLATEVQTGGPPASRLVEGGLVAAGGLLLVTPGVITDLVGFALVVPLTRRWLAPRVLASLTGRLDPEAWKVDIGAPTRYQPSPRPVPDDKPSPFDHPVV